jgi:16S rRNA U1498 N3-methylase RsmE
MEKEEILQFARQMKPREDVIMFHSNSEDRHQALFMAHSNVMIVGPEGGVVKSH